MDVPPLKYLNWGGIASLSSSGPSGPVAVDRVELLPVRVEGTDACVRTYPWGFFLLSSENDAIVVLFRRQVCRIAALFPGVLPPFRIVCGRGWGSVLVGVDPLVVDRFLLVF